MSLQSQVNRNYTAGFPGSIALAGPHRAKAARIMSVTLGTDPGASTNRISRAFGYSGEQGELGGSTPQTGVIAADVPEVVVGGPNFFGILGNRMHYALYGDANGALDPVLDLPQYTEGEFFDMVTGLFVQLFNETTGTKSMTQGDGLAYVPNNIAVANNPLALPYGALVSFPSTVAVPTGFAAVGSTTGGSLAANTYYAKITARGASGETTPSAEVSTTTTGTTSSIAYSWTPSPGATGYDVWISNSTGTESSYFYVAGGSTATFTYTGQSLTAGTMPTANTASGAAPTGFIIIPNAHIRTTQSLAASALNALVVGGAVVQLTQ
jgi:hypothetical protein